MDNSTRVTALDFARGLNQVRDPYELLAAAHLIEDYIRAGNTIPTSTSGKIDFDARYRENLSPNEFNWSGYAAELIKACNTGNVLVLKSRQTGFSRLMTEFFAHQTREHGKTVLWLGVRGRNTDDDARLLKELGADMTLVKCMPFGAVTKEPGLRGSKGFDFVFADELAYLPHADDNAFLATIMMMGKRFIFGSTPCRPKGLFHDLWMNSHSFYKFRSTWDMPLYEMTVSHFERKEDLAVTTGTDRFQTEFMGEFGKEPNVATDQHWATTTVAGHGSTIPVTSGGHVFNTSTAVTGTPTYTTSSDRFGLDNTVETVDASSPITSGRASPGEFTTNDLRNAPTKEVEHRKTTRVKTASFNDSDYTDPVG